MQLGLDAHGHVFALQLACAQGAPQLEDVGSPVGAVLFELRKAVVSVDN